MITRLENGGYEINGTFLDKKDAYALFEFIERENHREDVLSRIQSSVESGSLNEKYIKNEKFIDDVVSDYEHAINNDDSWNYMVDNAISYVKEDYTKKDNKNQIER